MFVFFNKVERRRRDNINKWIVELSKVIPDCSNDQSKHGQVRYLIDKVTSKPNNIFIYIKSCCMGIEMDFF